jgi:outer membrane protein
MKNSNVALFVVLFLAVAGIYILHFTSNNSNKSKVEDTSGELLASDIKIAYIKIDSLVINYDYAQEMLDVFNKQQEAFTKEYGDKRNRFESQAASFQEKVKRGGFLTEESAIRERDRLLGEEQQIQKLDQDLSTKLSQIQANNNKVLLDSISNYLKIYNKDKKFTYILNSEGILLGEESLNITKIILDNLNDRFSKTKKN